MKPPSLHNLYFVSFATTQLLDFYQQCACSEQRDMTVEESLMIEYHCTDTLAYDSVAIKNVIENWAQTFENSLMYMKSYEISIDNLSFYRMWVNDSNAFLNNPVAHIV